MEPVFEFPITLPPRDARGLLQSLHAQLRGAILDGRLGPGLRLPSTRKLADAYAISRNTAVAAYDLLLSEGYVVARQGAGVFVASVLPRRTASKAPASDAANDHRLAAYWRDPPGPFLPPPVPAPSLAFSLGMPDGALFPFAL